MNIQYLMSQLIDNAGRIEALVQGVSQNDARWKPDTESWSILEVVNHLYDEEREDFRVMLDVILHHPDKPLPDIDPEGWVTARRYNSRDLDPSLAAYQREREASLEWLHSLKDTDWETAHETPFGPIKAGDMFAAWVTHDQLHMRQLVELHRALTEREAAPYQLRYAGKW